MSGDWTPPPGPPSWLDWPDDALVPVSVVRAYLGRVAAHEDPDELTFRMWEVRATENLCVDDGPRDGVSGAGGGSSP